MLLRTLVLIFFFPYIASAAMRDDILFNVGLNAGLSFMNAMRLKEENFDPSTTQKVIDLQSGVTWMSDISLGWQIDNWVLDIRGQYRNHDLSPSSSNKYTIIPKGQDATKSYGKVSVESYGVLINPHFNFIETPYLSYGVGILGGFSKTFIAKEKGNIACVYGAETSLDIQLLQSSSMIAFGEYHKSTSSTYKFTLANESNDVKMTSASIGQKTFGLGLKFAL